MFDSFKSKTGVKELFLTDGKPPYKQALPLALQHVVAMIVGCVTPAIIVAGIALSRGEISPEDKIVLVQGALIVAAVATLLQLISLKNKVGSGLPVIMGVSFAYLATMQAVVQEFDLATLFGGSRGTEPFYERIFETFRDPDRHLCRICDRRHSRNGGLQSGPLGVLGAASEAPSFRDQV